MSPQTKGFDCGGGLSLHVHSGPGYALAVLFGPDGEVASIAGESIGIYRDTRRGGDDYGVETNSTLRGSIRIPAHAAAEVAQWLGQRATERLP